MTLADGRVVRVNKRSAFDDLTTGRMEAWLDLTPIIKATGSEKLECGRPRAIFGTSLEDYSIMSYVIDGVERHLHLIEGIEAGLTGASELQALLRRMTAFQVGIRRDLDSRGGKH